MKMMQLGNQSELIKKLRETTGAGIMDCKSAIRDAGGDIEKAKEIIKKKGLDIAKKKVSREAKEGQVVSYVHFGGKVGVLVELNCETDFVSRTPDFNVLAKDIAMQVAAATPLYVSREDVPEEIIEKEKDIIREQIKGKPQAAADKIVEGKLNKWFSEICLLEQDFIKDSKQKIKDYLTSAIAKVGENIIIRRFVRFELGETLSKKQ